MEQQQERFDALSRDLCRRPRPPLGDNTTSYVLVISNAAEGHSENMHLYRCGSGLLDAQFAYQMRHTNPCPDVVNPRITVEAVWSNVENASRDGVHGSPVIFALEPEQALKYFTEEQPTPKQANAAIEALTASAQHARPQSVPCMEEEDILWFQELPQDMPIPAWFLRACCLMEGVASGYLPAYPSNQSFHMIRDICNTKWDCENMSRLHIIVEDPGEGSWDLELIQDPSAAGGQIPH